MRDSRGHVLLYKLGHNHTPAAWHAAGKAGTTAHTTVGSPAQGCRIPQRVLAEVICCLSWSASSVEYVRTLDHPRLLPKPYSCHSAFTPFTPAAKHQAPSSEIMYACSVDLCHDSACAWQHYASTTVCPQSIMKDQTGPNSPKGPVSGRLIGCCPSIRLGHLWHASTPSTTFTS